MVSHMFVVLGTNIFYATKMIETKEEVNKRLGTRLQKLRKNAKLSQEKFAELCGCSSQTISGIETGYSFPSINLLFRICKALNTNCANLFNFYYEEIAPDKDDIEILVEYNKLNENKKAFILQMIKYLNKNEL